MKITVQGFLFLMLCPFVLVGQSLEYYKKVLETSQDKEVQLVALDSLIHITLNSDPNSLEAYGRQYIETAQEIGRQDLAAQKALQLFPLLTEFSGEPINSIWVVNTVLTQKEKIADSFLLGSLYLNRGKAFSPKNSNKAINEYSFALRSFAQSDTLMRAQTHFLRARAQSDCGKFAEAYDDYTIAHSLYKSLRDYESMIYAQQGISNMFSINGFYQKAKEERERLIKTIQDLNLDYPLANEYFSQAEDYRRMGKHKLEYETLLTAEDLAAKDSSNKQTYINIHAAFVSYYSKNNQLDEAKKHLDLLKAIDYDFDNDLRADINLLEGRINYLLAIGEFEKALELAKRRLDLSKQLDNGEIIRDSYNLLSNVYFQTNNFKESVESYRMAAAIKDSLHNKSTINALAYYQTLYETEKKERELIEQASSISLLEKDNESFKKAVILSSVVGVLTFIVIILYRNHLSMQNRKRLNERFSQKLLHLQENERKRISENLHDGVGQQLLVIKNRLVSSDDEDTKKLLDDAIEEIRSISRDLHPVLLKELGITKAIKYTINRIDENTKLFITSEIDNIDNKISKENEVNIFRIVQESISNILKHANADAAKITIENNPKSIKISIRDNGIGFDFSEKYLDPKSLGLKTLMERTRFLNGQMKVTSKEDSGTYLEFQIPTSK